MNTTTENTLVTPDTYHARDFARRWDESTTTFVGLVSGPWGEDHAKIEIDQFISNDAKVLGTDGNAYELIEGWYVVEGN